jgi:hypothetical protein
VRPPFGMVVLKGWKVRADRIHTTTRAPRARNNGRDATDSCDRRHSWAPLGRGEVHSLRVPGRLLESGVDAPIGCQLEMRRPPLSRVPPRRARTFAQHPHRGPRPTRFVQAWPPSRVSCPAHKRDRRRRRPESQTALCTGVAALPETARGSAGRLFQGIATRRADRKAPANHGAASSSPTRNGGGYRCITALRWASGPT